ncbi:lytic murein transglycosylase [Erythrobacter sp. EC-HK427]|uniref:lytic murein transglycosylase n=1 Tax=Erythrobacter sp. EC-HK427 TaxID=2038396 RepID=UPI0012525761|nr:lytic murein transglycosylase [Erythrobacter sp. EC-HK427]VVT15581.1 Lytic transglycosylase [Erythrobacter sp. EC-HK427]
MISKPLRLAALAIAASLAFATQANAQTQSFDAYLETVAAQARAEGVSQRTIDAVFTGLTPNNRVIELDRDQLVSAGSPRTSTGFPSMANYLGRHNTQARINGGVRTLARVRPIASRIEQEYGVPAEIVIAIWGHETSYGAVMGSFDLPRSLATLAWEGRRRDLFEPELIAVLKMVDQGVPRSRLVGSHAGAFGNGQFLPSVYLRLAVDADGDGQRDLWNSDADTLASIANYFRDAGWRQGEPWAVRAFVPNTADRSGIESRVTSPVCPRVHERHSRWLTVREWRARGIEPRAPIGDDVLATLFEPDGPAAPGYLLTQNYRVILEYNCSNYYAMSVGLLADEISR